MNWADLRVTWKVKFLKVYYLQIRPLREQWQISKKTIFRQVWMKPYYFLKYQYETRGKVLHERGN